MPCFDFLIEFKKLASLILSFISEDPFSSAVCQNNNRSSSFSMETGPLRGFEGFFNDQHEACGWVVSYCVGIEQRKFKFKWS